MDLNKINYDTLSSLATSFPANFEGLNLNNGSLEYQGKSISLNQFNINDLLGGGSLFASDISSLNSGDIFNIIKAHVDFLGINENTGASKYSFAELYNFITENTNDEKLNEYFDEINLLLDYEDYLLPSLKSSLEMYRNCIVSWSMEDNLDGTKLKAVNNYKENINKKNEQIEKNDVLKLKKEYKPNDYGFANVVQIVGLTIAAIVTLIVFTVMFV